MCDKSPKICKQCGICCLADVHAYITDEDRHRWIEEGRNDILSTLEREHAIWAGDHLISSVDGRYLHGCLFLTHDGRHFKCSIYETRPKTCRNYQPGSSDICPQYRR